ncbi:GNAT family N-acetyltransferase [Pseudovibrio axinellae]|uniref:GNAT family N-acetyltransferase n=1 Tax=Pseudovibrio axinellae TaxID=989403 RepID=UPI000834987D|nr:N-acetyltransferase [Pseudovibrio axinellae]
MTIRPFRETDFPRIQEIYARSKLDELTFEDQTFEFLPLDQDNRRFKGLLASQIVVYEQQEIVGYAARKHSEITALFVHPEGRGAGIGKTLMQHVLDKIKGEAILYVVSSNLPAIRLYERFGFALTKQFMTDYNGIPVSASMMVRRVTG